MLYRRRRDSGSSDLNDVLDSEGPSIARFKAVLHSRNLRATCQGASQSQSDRYVRTRCIFASLDDITYTLPKVKCGMIAGGYRPIVLHFWHALGRQL